MLHLGGEKMSLNEEDFSEIGRIDYCLVRRQQLLMQVQYLATSLNLVGDFGNSCETAYYFQLEHIQPRIEKYYSELELIKSNLDGVTNFFEKVFPFSNFLTNSYQILFDGYKCFTFSLLYAFISIFHYYVIFYCLLTCYSLDFRKFGT